MINSRTIRKITGAAYLALWFIFLTGLVFAAAGNYQYRTPVLILFVLPAFWYPAILFGWLLSRVKTRKMVRRLCLVGYWVCAVILFLVLLLYLSFSLPKERKMEGGYLELAKGQFLSETQYSYAEPKSLFFMQLFEWDAEHDIHVLRSKYQTGFTLSEASTDTQRCYIPDDHPEIQVRIYSYSAYGIIDDYQYKLCSSIALRCYQEENMPWSYEWGRSYEGDLCFVLHAQDDLTQAAEDFAWIIGEASKDPFYQSQVGWLSVEMPNGSHKVFYFGNYLPFRDEGLPPNYYADSQNVLAELEK